MTHPRDIMANRAAELASCLPGVLEAQPDSVHDARVATRRIRELLPLAQSSRLSSPDELRQCFRRAGRALGRVRDVDVHLALVSVLQRRLPTAVGALASLQQRYEEERQVRLRRLVKRLECLELSEVLGQLAARESAFDRARAWRPLGHDWRQDLRATLQRRSTEAADAVIHATGVYFPNRLHTGRIALKKLRYALEALHETGAGDRARELRQLRKAQDLLGELHDRETLLQAIDALDLVKRGGEFGDQGQAIVGLVRAECADLHQRYLARRPVLLDICTQEMRRRPSMQIGRAVSAGVVAAASVAAGRLVLVHRAASRRQDVQALRPLSQAAVYATAGQ